MKKRVRKVQAGLLCGALLSGLIALRPLGAEQSGPWTPVYRSLPVTYDHIIGPLARDAGLDPYLIKCIIQVESTFNPAALSPAGAMGLMQLMPEVADGYGATDPFSPVDNLKAGIAHFAWLMRTVNRDIPLALAAYHAGYGNVRRHGGIPPIEATRQYVDKVMFLYCGKTGFGRVAADRVYMQIEGDTINLYNSGAVK